MFEKNFYTLQGIATELKIDVSTIRDWQEQYEPWIPYAGRGKSRRYPKMALEVLRLVANNIKANMKTDQIEKLLSQEFPMVTETLADDLPGGEKMMPQTGEDGVSGIFKNLLEDFSKHQKRIADAQERRASAEEKRASALEKRADAETIKAQAFNSIASILQKTDLSFASAAIANQVHTTTQTIPADLSEPDDGQVADAIKEINELSESMDDTVNEPEPGSPGLSELTDESTSQADSDLADLSGLIEEHETKETPNLTNLSELVGEPTAQPDPDLADLSGLIEEHETKETSNQTNLSELVGEPTAQPDPDLADLSGLIEEHETKETPNQTNLSELVDEPTAQPDPDLADLSGLVGENETKETPNMTNLSELVGEPTAQAESNLADLSGLVDENEPPKTQKKPLAPKSKSSKNDHKKKMMTIIINLKEKEGLSIEETSKRLNDEGYETISGKGEWNKEMIQKIYGYIDSVRLKAEG